MSDALKENLRKVWDARTPGQKKTIVSLTVVLCVIAVIYVAVARKHATREGLQQAALKQGGAERTLLFDGDTLERDLYDRLQAELEEKSNQLEEAEKLTRRQSEKMDQILSRLEYLQQLQATRVVGASTREDKEKKEKKPEDEEVDTLAKIEIPPPPPPPPAAALRTASSDVDANRVFATPNPRGQQGTEIEEVIGAIGRVTSDEPVGEERKTTKKNSVYLAPSFMEAVLLSGMDAPITGDARDNPKPTLLRIAAPAVLPNQVKANLRGCFVIASGYGSLAEERINLRLIRLSCVARNGEAVIEEKIKGYVVDSDGKVGLHARVYMKAGPHLVRQFVAGVAQGVAEIVKSNNTTTSISALGATSAITSGQAAESGVAGGVSTAAQGLSEFYKKLAEQTLPTLEVGPKKKVTVVLEEGVELQIKNYCEECNA